MNVIKELSELENHFFQIDAPEIAELMHLAKVKFFERRRHWHANQENNQQGQQNESVLSNKPLS